MFGPSLSILLDVATGWCIFTQEVQMETNALFAEASMCPLNLQVPSNWACENPIPKTLTVSGQVFKGEAERLKGEYRSFNQTMSVSLFSIYYPGYNHPHFVPWNDHRCSARSTQTNVGISNDYCLFYPPSFRPLPYHHVRTAFIAQSWHPLQPRSPAPPFLLSRWRQQVASISIDTRFQGQSAAPMVVYYMIHIGSSIKQGTTSLFDKAMAKDYYLMPFLPVFMYPESVIEKMIRLLNVITPYGCTQGLVILQS